MTAIRTLRIPIALWIAAAERADKDGLPTTTWLLLALAKAVRA